jgi:hypothetical protein
MLRAGVSAPAPSSNKSGSVTAGGESDIFTPLPSAQHIQALYSLATCYFYIGNLNDATVALRQCVTYAPTNPKYLETLAAWEHPVNRLEADLLSSVSIDTLLEMYLDGSAQALRKNSIIEKEGGGDVLVREVSFDLVGITYQSPDVVGNG